MALYHFDKDKISSVPSTTLANEGIRERRDLQALLKENPEIISPDTLIIAEEFGNWDDSRRRIDLLGVNKDANLVVIELKREDSGHMDLQAIRYAAMVSAMTFEMLVEHYEQFLKKTEDDQDAREILTDHFNWDESDVQLLGQNPQIVLASGEFSKELTTSVLWLNDQGLDIRCVRFHPYNHQGQLLLDVQTIIPVPEAEEYQIQIRNKRQSERLSRKRKIPKFDVTVGGEQITITGCRYLMFRIIEELFKKGKSPKEIASYIPSSKLKEFQGELNSNEVIENLMKEDKKGWKYPWSKRFFTDQEKLFHVEGKTFVLSNQWVSTNTLDILTKIKSDFPELNIVFREINE